jgi:hypothetical protein
MFVTVGDAIDSLVPGARYGVAGNTYAGIEWFSSDLIKPTEEEVINEMARLESLAPIEACKTDAKALIAKSDWSVLPDVGISNGAEFVAYRAILRELIKNPVATPVFPTEPQPVWI